MGFEPCETRPNSKVELEIPSEQRLVIAGISFQVLAPRSRRIAWVLCLHVRFHGGRASSDVEARLIFRQRYWTVETRLDLDPRYWSSIVRLDPDRFWGGERDVPKILLQPTGQPRMLFLDRLAFRAVLVVEMIDHPAGCRIESTLASQAYQYLQLPVHPQAQHLEGRLVGMSLV